MKQHDIGDLVKIRYGGTNDIIDIVGVVVRRFWDSCVQSWYYTCYFGEHGTCDCEQSTLKNLTKSDQ
jgi:hypothetical protein